MKVDHDINTQEFGQINSASTGRDEVKCSECLEPVKVSKAVISGYSYLCQQCEGGTE